MHCVPVRDLSQGLNSAHTSWIALTALMQNAPSRVPVYLQNYAVCLLQADLGPLPDNSPASFFMAQGLKSLAGGNVHAAIHRLGRCREALLQATAAGQQQQSTLEGSAGAPGALAFTAQSAKGNTSNSSQQQGDDGSGPGASSMDVDSSNGSSGLQQQCGVSMGSAAAGPASATAAACQIAAVCGSLGDCYQRLGNSLQAEQLYLESISSVQPHSESDAEAAHAMSVSLNKLGDMRYTQQQLQDAKQLYKQALQLRQLYCGPLTKGEAGPEPQLELASSLIKVADVCKVSVAWKFHTACAYSVDICEGSGMQHVVPVAALGR